MRKRVNGKKFKVLLIDDEPLSLFMARNALEKVGCNVTTVRDGAQATDQVQKQKYDLVILDWKMPVRDGKETMQAFHYIWRHLKRVKTRLPLILYTGIEPNKFDLPHSPYIELYDYWYKMEGRKINKRIEGVLHRLQRRNECLSLTRV